MLPLSEKQKLRLIIKPLPLILHVSDSYFYVCFVI